MKSRLLAILAVTWGLQASVANAGLLNINGDTTGDPTWNRPVGAGPALSAVGTATPYEVNPFYVSASGPYDLEITSAGSGFDTYLHLYDEDGFDPTNQLIGLIAGNDDGGVGLLSMISAAALTAGMQYYAVVSGFANADFGTYTLEISGQGDIASGTIPEPSTIALLSVALAGLGFFRRRKLH